MKPLGPEDERIHQDYPRGAGRPWKENWYFNFVDREHEAWGINHVSLERHTGQGRFTAFHIVDGDILLHAGRIDLPVDFSVLTDGALRLEFPEPHRRFRVTFTGPRHSLDLEYRARFGVYDYPHEAAAPGAESFEIRHYEQALTVTGTLTKDGIARPISCLGHRDHSWGYRDESDVAGWNWVAVQFPERTINLSEVRMAGAPPLRRGFVSDASGNTGLVDVRVVATERNADGIPESSTFEVTDDRGRKWTLVSRRFSGLVIPLVERGGEVVIYENFAEFSLAETGEKGVGIDEYLDNPR